MVVMKEDSFHLPPACRRSNTQHSVSGPRGEQDALVELEWSRRASERSSRGQSRPSALPSLTTTPFPPHSM